MTFEDRLFELLRAGHRCVRVSTSEEDEAIAGVVATAMSMQRTLTAWSCVRGVYPALVADAPGIAQTENPAAGLYQLGRVTEPSILLLLDMMSYLRDDQRVLRAWRELLARCATTGSCLVMMDHEDSSAAAPAVVKAHSIEVEVPMPDQEQIERVLRSTLRDINQRTPIEADLSRQELSTILKNLHGLTSRQVAQVVRDVTIPDKRLSIEDLNHVLAAKRRFIQADGVLEFVESPVSLDQIGGLDRLKRWLEQRKVSLRDDAVERGLVPPRGILLLGVQGAGKSLSAKAIGTAWGRPILRLDAGALYDRFVGESERRLREALRQAEAMAPVVLWIDEIEKAFAGAANTSTDGGLSRRMFGALLTWMQEHRAPVFLAATANDIEALPPELLRKGRFDEIFFVDLPGPKARTQIVDIHLKKRKQDPARFDRTALVAACAGFSGAEIEQAISSGLAEALSEGRTLDTETLVRVMRTSPPLSVTMRERVEALRAWAVGRCVAAETIEV